MQLVDRQTGRYDPADLEDRYETRLQAMIDAKIKGGDVTAEEEIAPRTGNVVDLMAALKRSLGETAKVAPSRDLAPASATKAPKRAKAHSPDDLRRQPAFKLPIEGGQKQTLARSSVEVAKAEPVGSPPARAARLREQQPALADRK